VTNYQIDQLMKRIIQKDSAALEELYKNMSKPVYFYVLRLTGDQCIAEDVMQDTFVTLMRKSDLYREEGKGKSWIFTIAKNLTTDIQRKIKRVDSFDIYSETADGTDFTYQKDMEIETLRMLDILSEKEKDIVMLRLLSDMTLTEVAKELAIPSGTVFWTYNNAIKKMRKKFAGGDSDEK